MNVIHLQYGSSASGNYTITLHDLMTANGINSSVLSLFSNFTPKDKEIRWLGKFPNYKAGIDHKVQKFLNRDNRSELGDFSYPILGTDISSHESVNKADVIYVHWVLNGFLNIESLMKLAKLGKPMVFVLHDMWTFTSGCHYSFDCRKYTKNCGNCPILNKDLEKDRSFYLFQEKRNLFNDFKNIYFISPSIWMKNNALEATLLKGKLIQQIYNPVSESFYPKAEILGKYISKSNDKKIIGFGANYINSPYKGFKYMLEAIKIIAKTGHINDYEILVFGGNLSEEIIQEIAFKVSYTSFLTSEEDICEAYNSMDVFVIPSLADNLPTTVLESLKCGVPVVGFQTGGIPEMINHLENGFLAEKFNSQELADGIVYCLENDVKGYLTEKFDSSSIFEAHKSFLNQIIELV
ncbi:glycosyltransferase [Belliella aquatica]|uniref:Glycosyl transferase n=1 Tax=Belliella aquatica TaxID=1323734 RepID=A0ABQ1N486_9BACT|nr:glycosyltransferase [Belliella aquatica]MCH7404601.1 glycosyltransferase [Belliella aquatica]GGC53618.1 glycosyl transferase [Belliella aquatica]